MQYPAFCDGTYESLARPANNQLLVNMYRAPMSGDGAATKFSLYPSPGVQTLATHSSGVGRAHFYNNSREFAVIGTSFVEISQAGTITARGTVALDNNPATICANGATGKQLMITSGGNGYIFDISTNVFSTVSFLAGKSSMGAQLDGYFIVLDSSASTFYISALLDGTTWSALDFAHRTRAPDPWVGMYVMGRYVWLLGERTSEIWYDNGASPFPFTTYAVGIIPFGCAAPFSGAIAGQTLSWLAQTSQGGYAVVSVAGFTPDPISTVELSEQISSYSGVSDAVGDSYTEDGHTHYLLSFPSRDITWTYDQTSESWAQRGTWVSEHNTFTAWRPRFHAWAFGEHRMLDAAGPNVYQMSVAYTSDVDGRVIRRVRRAPILAYENQRITVRDFELEIESGLGNAVAPGDDPQVMLRISRDGGETWGKEVMAGGGKTGQYRKRVRWNRLGQGRRLQFEISVTDPIPWRVLNADINFDGIEGRPSQQMMQKMVR